MGWTEAFANAGRGAGKDDAVKTVGVYECRFGGHEVAAAPGQRLPALVICPLRNQAQGFVRMGLGEAHLPFNRRFVARETSTRSSSRTAPVPGRDGRRRRRGWRHRVHGRVQRVADVPGRRCCGVGREIETNIRPALRRVIGAPPKRSSSSSDRATSKTTPRGNASETISAAMMPTSWSCMARPSSSNPNIDRAWLAAERKKLGDVLYEMHFDGRWVDVIVAGYFPDGARARGCIQHGQLTCLVSVTRW